MPLQAGTRLGPYEVLSLIGAGGMGEVYQARDTRLDRPVAVKVLAAELAADPEFRARFEREAKAISSLNHPHICGLYDIGREQDAEYLVLELLEGETLAARLERGPLRSSRSFGDAGLQIVSDELRCLRTSPLKRRDHIMRLAGILVAAMLLYAGVGAVRAQDAEAEKTIIANERAATNAFAKGNVAAFTGVVATDGWAIDSMTGRAPVADLVKDFAAVTKEVKISSWDITESKFQWPNATTAIHSYKWTGKGTDHGQPIPSPTWAATVWTKRDGKWMAIFHQESAAPPASAKH